MPQKTLFQTVELFNVRAHCDEGCNTSKSRIQVEVERQFIWSQILHSMIIVYDNNEEHKIADGAAIARNIITVLVDPSLRNQFLYSTKKLTT